MSTPVLALNYWLHLVATITWLGGLAMLTLVVWPGVIITTNAEATTIRRTLQTIERRFRPLANISLAVLLVTGMIQMGADSHYEGFLAFTNNWSVVMLIKHLLVIVMIAVTGVIQGLLLPELSRIALLAERLDEQALSEESILQNRLRRLTTVNLSLGVLVLLMTAIMTAL